MKTARVRTTTDQLLVATVSDSVQVGWLVEVYGKIGVVCAVWGYYDAIHASRSREIPYESVETTKYGTIWRYAEFPEINVVCPIRQAQYNVMIFVPCQPEEYLRELFNEQFWRAAEAGL